MKKIVIAIDGPAAAGKGTLSQLLSKEYNLAVMDTGALYRGVAYFMHKNGIPFEAEEQATEYAKRFTEPEFLEILTSDEIRANHISQGASIVSAIQPVRKALFDVQVSFAKNPPEDKNGCILDGRDIGTVICPNADVKFFLKADVDVRAERRHKELIEKGKETDFQIVLDDMKKRDERDSNRSSAPLKAADDAVIIDTTKLSIDEMFEKAKEIVNSKV